MTDFFDWLTVGDSGLAADRLAEAYKLSHNEFRRTAEALAPAYAAALTRTMQDPQAWNAVSERAVPFLAAGGFPPHERRDAMASLTDALFGSSETSRQVARHASPRAGLAPDATERLMQDLSVLTMQTMVQMMLANVARGRVPAASSQGDYPAMVADLMRRTADAVESFGRTGASSHGRSEARSDGDPLPLLFADAFTGFLPMLPPDAEERRTRPTGGGKSVDNGAVTPLEAMFAAFARGLSDEKETDRKTRSDGSERSPADDVPASEETSETAADPWDFDAFARAGEDMQREYARQVAAMMDLAAPGTPPASDGRSRSE